MFLNNSSQSCSTISDLMTHVLRSHILQKCILKIHSRLRTKVKNEAYTLLLIFTSRICGNVVHKVKSLKTRSAKPKRIHLFHRVNRLQASRALFHFSVFRHHQAFYATLYHYLIIFGLAIPLSMCFFITASYNNQLSQNCHY